MPEVLTGDDIRRAVHRIAHEIIEHTDGAREVALVGIQTRGVPLANRIAEAILGFEEQKVPVGTLDIGLYRDDLDRRPVTRLTPTALPDIDDVTVVLVDDVLYTGRTVRAALDALADFGRPRAVRLAVLVDRGHRQLPIRPDFVGKNLPTALSERVSVLLTETDDEDGVWIRKGGTE